MAGSKESTPSVQDPERELTCVMLKTVVTLLKGSVRNAGKDGTKFVLSLLGKTVTIFGDLCQCSKEWPALMCG